jgi:cobalt-zinc-cadmium efflux system protein
MAHDHDHRPADSADGRWLAAAFGVLVVFIAAEVVAGLLAHSLALLSDAGHLLTDAAALLVALISIRIARRPARGSYTYGFARADALAGQANGITLVVLAVLFTVGAVHRLIDPATVTGSVLTVVAGVGIVVNGIATLLAKRADRGRLSVRGAVAHLVNDGWAFLATATAGLVIIITGWNRADAIASLVIAALMVFTGSGLIRASGRIFLEAAPVGLDPDQLGAELAAVDGVAQVHDLHVWQLGPNDTAISAHVLVHAPGDCHAIGDSLRQLLADRHGLRHATLQVDHLSIRPGGLPVVDHCDEPHGRIHQPVPWAGDAATR